MISAARDVGILSKKSTSTPTSSFTQLFDFQSACVSQPVVVGVRCKLKLLRCLISEISYSSANFSLSCSSTQKHSRREDDVFYYITFEGGRGGNPAAICLAYVDVAIFRDRWPIKSRRFSVNATLVLLSEIVVSRFSLCLFLQSRSVRCDYWFIILYSTLSRQKQWGWGGGRKFLYLSKKEEDNFSSSIF